MNALIRTLSVGTLTVAAACMLTPTAHAQGMTLTEQQIEAQRLSALCKQPQPPQGSMRAYYEAAANLAQCFYDNVDSRYPAELKQKWLATISQYRAMAQQYQ